MQRFCGVATYPMDHQFALKWILLLKFGDKGWETERIKFQVSFLYNDPKWNLIHSVSSP